MTQSSGFIASYVTENTGCGGIDAPWVIRLQPGAQINFTLWDFDLPTEEELTASLSSGLPPPCHVYAIVKVNSTKVNALPRSALFLFDIPPHI